MATGQCHHRGGSFILLLGLPAAIGEDPTGTPRFEGWLDDVDYIVSNWILPLGGLGVALFVGYRLRRSAGGSLPKCPVALGTLLLLGQGVGPGGHCGHLLERHRRAVVHLIKAVPKTIHQGFHLRPRILHHFGIQFGSPPIDSGGDPPPQQRDRS